MADKNILATFEGTFKTAHPEGHRGEQVTRPFKCRVKIPRHFLKPIPNTVPALRHVSLTAVFGTYYKQHLKKAHPEMLDLYRWRLVEATELDGSVMDDPKCLSYQGLLDFVKEKEYPINPLLYPTDQELRDAILLYEDDETGQQKLQKRWEQITGPVLKVSQEIAAIDNVFEELTPMSSAKPVYMETKPVEEVQYEHREQVKSLPAKTAKKAVPNKASVDKPLDDFFAEPEEQSSQTGIEDELAPGVEMKELDASAIK